MNQLDLSFQHSEIKELLPQAVRIKDVTEIDDADHFFTVVYSDTPDQSVKYDLKVVVVASKGKSLRLEGTVNLGDYGQFCGTRVVGVTKTLDGRAATDFLVYADNSGGSSNYIAVYSYLVKKNPS
jgi:hypothetical protein